MVALSIAIGYFLLIVYMLTRQVARTEMVNKDVILESINGYLLLGLCGSFLFHALNSFQSNAFAVSNSLVLDYSEFVYLSFMIQTSNGYGDIIPLTGPAKLLLVSLGVVGQLYVAIIIAMLVGKHISHGKVNQKT